MALDPFAARFLDMVGAANRLDGAAASLETYRSGYDNLSSFAAIPDPGLCATADFVSSSTAGPAPIRIFTPSDAGDSPLPLIVWLHGGGWIAGGFQSCDPLCRSLAIASGCRIAAVGYRLAPEHPFPAGLEDCRAAVLNLWERVEEFGSTRERFAIGADSAGAHLAAGVLPDAIDAGVDFKLAFFICPVIDPFGNWPSRRQFASGYLLEEAALSDYIRLYGCDLDPDDDRVSPLRSRRLGDFPPAIVHTAECDPVRDEGEGLARALMEAGVSVQYTRHPGLIHNFFSLTSVIPRARLALAEIGLSLAQGMR